MSIYWKQSLWLGGIFWIISLILWGIDTYSSYLTEFILSMLLAIFLIPMNFLKPIKFIEKAMKKLPIVSTFLTFVGWAPYFSVVVFLLSVIYGGIMVLGNIMPIDGVVLTLITPLTILTVVKTSCIVFSFVLAAFYVFVYKRSVAGCLNEKFRLAEDGVCETTLVVEEAYAEHAKKMYKCKKEVSERQEKAKIAKEKKKTAKKVVKEKKKEEKKKVAAAKKAVKARQKEEKASISDEKAL